jgi:hypothetical protein
MSVYESIRASVFDNETIAASSGPPTSGTQPVEDGLANHIVATLSSRAADHPKQLHWQSSTVDLLELLGLDSSVANRRRLARELAYTGDLADTVAMDSWLHRTVMRNLAGHGQPNRT